MKPCVKVYVDRIISDYIIGKTARPGVTIGGSTIIRCVPDPCVITRGTKIVFSKAKKYTVSRRDKYVVFRSGNEIYVYPAKIYDIVYEKYISKLMKGELKHHGVIFAGAPGTGKSSLARIIAENLGIDYNIVSPGDVRRKFLGEAEWRIREIFMDAIESQPYILIFDDAEWMLSSRKLGEGDEQEARIHNILLNEFLVNFDKIAKEHHQVLIIATTNKKVSELDPAIRRGGRFGDPIIFPLPDIDMIKLIFKEYGVSVDDEYVIKLLNAGVETSAIVNDIIPELKKGRKPRIKPREGRGYRRVYFDPIKGVEKLFEYISKDIFSKNSRIWIPYNANIAIPLAVNMASAAGKSAVLISNLEYVEEAIPMANMYGSVVIFPSGISYPLELYVDANAENAVIFYGKKPPYVESFRMFSLITITHIIGVEDMLKIYLEYTGIKLDKDSYNRVLGAFSSKTSDEDIEAFLSAITTLRHIDDKIISMI